MKLLAIGDVGAACWERDEWVVHSGALSYFARMTDAQTFGELARVETHRRGTERAAVGALWAACRMTCRRLSNATILGVGLAGRYKINFPLVYCLPSALQLYLPYVLPSARFCPCTVTTTVRGPP